MQKFRQSSVILEKSNILPGKLTILANFPRVQ